MRVLGPGPSWDLPQIYHSNFSLTISSFIQWRAGSQTTLGFARSTINPQHTFGLVCKPLHQSLLWVPSWVGGLKYRPWLASE